MKSIFDPDDQVDLALVDAGLGRRLSKLSNNSKHAFTLNQVQRVKVCATYDREDEDGATVYVLDVYLQYVQRGLPTTPGETTSERRSRLQQEKEEAEPEYQVEHRYSAFRELRRRITKIVHDRKHMQWCAYCSRVTWITSVEGFPSRFPNRGRWAVYTGWRRLLIHTRKRKLERFVNQILRAAKDLSYRRGGGQCQRFIEVSHILNTFLMDPDLRPEGCVW
ncbi:Phox homologous domain [Phytophthora cactorum]|nr:Phox homologous domain [Phytophthora cactorum]